MQINEAHIHVATSLSEIPTAGNNNPVPGQFDHKLEFSPGVQEFTYEIDIPSGSIVVIHLAVTNGTQNETAFAGDNKGASPRWWWYIERAVSGCFYSRG